MKSANSMQICFDEDRDVSRSYDSANHLSRAAKPSTPRSPRARSQKSNFPSLTVDPLDPPVYMTGYNTFDPKYTKFDPPSDFCKALLGNAVKQGIDLRWISSKAGAVNDRTPCASCGVPTLEKLHGGGFWVAEMKPGVTGTWYHDTNT